MISCTESIHVYNEFFNYIDKRYGPEAVETFWHFVADTSLEEPRQAIREGGMDAIYTYLKETWEEEGDVFDIHRDENSVTVEVHNCSSVRKLRKAQHIKRYVNYCGHCPVVYERFFDDLGYRFEMELINPDLGICKVRVTSKDGI